MKVFCMRCGGPWADHAIGMDPGFDDEKGMVVVVSRTTDNTFQICQAVPLAYLDQDLDQKF